MKKKTKNKAENVTISGDRLTATKRRNKETKILCSISGGRITAIKRKKNGVLVAFLRPPQKKAKRKLLI